MAVPPQHLGASYSNYPLKDIAQPHAHDVLCGRGGGTNNHVGNSHWRMLVAANKQLYITLPKRQKMLLSRSIVNAVRSQNPPGRFLQKDNKSNLWFDVGDQRAQEKTSQALREGAPDIRKKVAASKEGAAVSVDSTGKSSIQNSGESEERGQASEEPASTSQEDSNNNNNKNNTNNNNDSSPTPNDKETSSHQEGEGQDKVTSNTSVPQKQQQQEQQLHPQMMFPPQYFPHSSGGSFGSNSTAQQPQNMGGMFPGNHPMMQMMFPTMVMNHDGVMVPAISVMTPQQQQQMMMMTMMMANGGGMNNNNNNIHNMSPQVSVAGSAMTQQASNIGATQNYQNHHHQQQHQQEQHSSHHHDGADNFEPLPVDHDGGDGADFGYNPVGNDNHHLHHHHNNENSNVAKPTPTFDEFVQAPDNLEPAGVSFGSIHMTDAEMKQLQALTATSNHSSSFNNDTHGNPSYSNNDGDSKPTNGGNEAIPAALNGLEPTGISFGDVSMMSSGTSAMRLEETGASFGTMMSFNTMSPDMVDGGLMEAIGTSFGSLSLDATNRQSLFQALEVTGGGPQIPPMFHSEEKATGNLLDCSDTESENSQDKEMLTQQKSQAWERMKTHIATETKLKHHGSKGSVDSHDLMPPPVGNPNHDRHEQYQQHHQQEPQQQQPASTNFVDAEVTVPTTTLENNFSTLSAWSAADDFDGGLEDLDAAAAPPPPQALKKEESW
eukprot:CAMPEP_0178830546 /NCGR_PEP_ID=MMETSP0746-20121128/8977_1 /TAXON_ID=913974 /ORGANISM="Nitzschia punctata, Strain CCMP561" /LENGTH=717 /DNA_ID=CAMNT_0020492713 /DNA_START=59 /DNA_END=2212 /DNA_ORIENTATION=+